jgi:M6 family metalloprotease-like protein
MKRFLLLLSALFLMQISYAAWHENIPQTIEQPDGTVINCLATGDEVYHWLHDANGYTIVLNPEDGFFYYGKRVGDQVVPSVWVAGAIDPALTGLPRYARISEQLYAQRRAQYQNRMKASYGSPTRGTVNSICIYISFTGDSVFGVKREQYKNIWSSTTTPSVKDFFKEISYNALNLEVYHYPESPDSITVSYVDPFPRKYYLPWSVSNPEGYRDSETGQREHAMLKRAVEFIQNQIPADLDLDMNDDNTVDNISFVIRGSSSAWSDLLWPHAWSLYTYTVMLKGSRVGSYFLTMENGFGVGTFCHELGHVFGAPDLYHYTDTGAPNAVGGWCLMNSSANPPQSICGFLKYKYNKWIPELPEITESGTYTILPLSQPTRNLFKIKSPYSRSEYFVLEYRKREGKYEIMAPGNGLLVYRINPGAGNGNAGGPPDEVYTYRPNGTITVEGSLSTAPFGTASRKSFNDKTNPSCFLWADREGSKGGLDLSEITIYPDSVTFKVKIENRFPPTSLVYTPAAGLVDLDWDPCLSPGFRTYYIYRNGTLLDSTALSYYRDSPLQENTPYTYYITGLYSGEHAGESAQSNPVTYTPKGILSLPYEESFEERSHGWMIKEFEEGFRWGDAITLEMPTENATKFIGANSILAGENTKCRDYAITPRLNLSGKTKVNLYFDYTLKRWQQLDHLKIFFRRSPSEAWIPVIDMPTSGFGPLYKWRRYSLEIPPDAYAATAQIGFYYDDGDGMGYGAGIDNIVIREPAAGVEGLQLEAMVNVYPNPASDKITVELSNGGIGGVSYRLIGADGKIVSSVVRPTPSSVEIISLDGLPSGLYHLMIETDAQVVVKSIIKQ